MAVIDITTPSILNRPSFYPLTLKHGSVISTTKFAGFRNQYAGINHSTLLTKIATHVQDTGGYNAIPKDKKFTLIKLGTAGGNAIAPVDSFYSSGQGYAAHLEYNRGSIITSELGEELGNHVMQINPTWDYYADVAPYVLARTNAWHKGFSDAIASHNGIPLGEVNCFGEYGHFHIPNGGRPGSAYGDAPKAAMYRGSLASQASAKKKYVPSTNTFLAGEDDYFAENRYNSHNFCHRAYYQSLGNLGGNYIPEFLYIIERMYLAAPDRRQILFTWDQIQDLTRVPNLFLDGKAGWRFRFQSPPGHLVMAHTVWRVMPPYIAEALTFIACLHTTGFVCWNSQDGFADVPIDGNHKSVLGHWDYDNPHIWRYNGAHRKWKPLGSPMVDWNPSTPGHPGDYNSPGITGGFPYYPNTTVDAMVIAHRKYGQIEPYLSGRVKWATFSTDGGTNYYTPSSGSEGVYISSYGNPNYNASNPALDIPINRQPYATYCNGVCMYFDPYTLPNQSKHVVFKDGADTFDLGNLPGSRLIIKIFR